MSDYEPLRVTAELKDPIILDRNQPLDGILGATIIESPDLRQRDRYYRNFRRSLARRGREATLALWAERGWDVPTRPHFVPLALWGHGNGHGLWVYCSSWAIPGDVAEFGLAHFSHQFDAELAERTMEPVRGKIQTRKGEYKSEHIPFQYMTVGKLTWYVDGVRSEIEEILSATYAIGKKRNRGYGGVARWSVEEGEDWSVFTPEGELMRPVPCDLLEQYGISGEFRYSFTTYRPPYWDLRYAARCAVSGVRDEGAGE